MYKTQEEFVLNSLSEDTTPPIDSVSSVHAIIFHSSKIVVIQNKRGLDIPGGHVEKNETLDEALRREIKEEAELDVENPLKFILSLSLRKPSSPKMLFAVSQTKNTPQNGNLMTISDFLAVYTQTKFKKAMREILKQASTYDKKSC